MAIAVPAGIDPLAMTVQPMSVRTDYQLSTRGHRFVGRCKGEIVIDTDWHPTAAKASAALGRAFAKLATASAARYSA